jgi:WD40 repeat protein
MLGIFDVASGKELVRKPGYRGLLYNIEFSSDGQRFLTNGSDTIARLWHTATGQPAGPPLRHPRFCRQASLAPDGWRVVTVDSGGILRLWDGQTGDLLGRLVPPANVGKVWFSRDGRRLILFCLNTKTRSLDPSGKVFELPTFSGSSRELRPLLQLLTGLQPETGEGIGEVDRHIFMNDPAPYERAWLSWRGQGVPDNGARLE